MCAEDAYISGNAALQQKIIGRRRSGTTGAGAEQHTGGEAADHPQGEGGRDRAEEGSVGYEGVSRCRTRGSANSETINVGQRGRKLRKNINKSEYIIRYTNI